ncbi:hypothetical protein LM599_01090 [Candidatus Acetothermia bacterium]|jgi:pyruvate/2-oxoacid:ferredoxin oxidoreductase beta subunit|nr:hypothetical protein [Candidatus Acetothermia bacterium]
MPSLGDYKGQTHAWCSGCGNLPILKAFKDAMIELGIEPYQLTRDIDRATRRCKEECIDG